MTPDASDCLIDLNPLSLEEAERYLFGTYRVEYEYLPEEFKAAVGQLTQQVAADYESWWGKETTIQECLDSKLAEFNTNRIRKFTQGYLADAVVKGKVNSFRAYDFDIWVEYTGLTQKQMDGLPPFIRAQLFNRYLQGYNEYRAKAHRDPDGAQQLLESTLREVLQGFKGKILSPQMLAMVRQSILNTGLVDECEGPISDGYGHVYLCRAVTDNGDHLCMNLSIGAN